MYSQGPTGITTTNTLATTVTTTVATTTTQSNAVTTASQATTAAMPGGRLEALTVRQVPTAPAHAGFANFLATLLHTIHPGSKPPSSLASEAPVTAAGPAQPQESPEEEMLRLEGHMKGFGLHRGAGGTFELEANGTFDARRDGTSVLRYLTLRATHPSGMPMSSLHPWIEFARCEMPSPAHRTAARRLYLEKTVNLGARPGENLERWLCALEHDMRHPQPPLDRAELDQLAGFLADPDAAAAALQLRLTARLEALLGPMRLGGVLTALLVGLEQPPVELLRDSVYCMGECSAAAQEKFLAALLRLPLGDDFTALSAAFVAQVLPQEPPTWHAAAKAALVRLAQGQRPDAADLALQAVPPDIWLAIVAKAATACPDGPSAVQLVQRWMPSGCAVARLYVRLFEAVAAEDERRGRPRTHTCRSIHAVLREHIEAQNHQASVSRTVVPFAACCVRLGEPWADQGTPGWALGQICMGFAHVGSGDRAAAEAALSQAGRYVKAASASLMGRTPGDSRIARECAVLAAAVAAMGSMGARGAKPSTQ
jgi:hypothetical protein